ncbi:50S ribosomal protein L11 methyltransferase [Devosia sp. XJ19-1]|uniref:50S ribosomal protein L11 methyltransferase n=1 Tax=Devosia ureilytica TaxID=2952754 RepID=A0A9Q4ANT9_9HYPH|nr:50S ribosomal protein L11 methyltransferase [Devosia ureilytica]MCP8882664.1 50S ribosomal protein L11 methyltransferase [Devosia ureilytica]MCP8886968.1 50S ribosomal protein L11 methyltransferase [Devosia ureilytica]
MSAASVKQRAARFIRERLTLKALPFRPDITLYSPTPQSGLNGWLTSEGLERTPPYWAYAWGGGAALALYLRDHPEAVLGKRVLDFGAGSGLVGIAAAKAGAASVLAVEPDPVGQVALRLNAEANNVSLALWTEPALPPVDIILAGDIFYLPEVVGRTLPILLDAAAQGANVLVGDPFRRDLPLDRLDLLIEYAVADMGGSAPVRAGVFALRP